MPAILAPLSSFAPLLRALGLIAPCLLLAADPAPTPLTHFAPDAANPRFTGTPFARTWLAQDYNASPTNRGVLQHPHTGFLYFCNAGGILEFDGTRWRTYRAPGRQGIDHLAVDARGRLWFSTASEIGCLLPDARGELQAVSFHEKIPADEHPSFPLDRCLATADGVYFAARDRVVRFSLDPEFQVRTWRFTAGGELTAHLWLMDGRLHVRGPQGVFALHDDGFRPVEALRTFAFATRPAPDGGWHLLNRDGLRRWDDGYRPVAPGLPALVPPHPSDTALCAVFLRDGRIAYGTTRSGLIVCDPQGRPLQAIGRDTGLLSDRVEALCEDREGGLWVASRNGLVRLQLDSPYARHGLGPNRIDSTPTALGLHERALYVGGGEGLWRRAPRGDFHPVSGLSQFVRSLVSLQDSLYVTGVELRRILPDDTTRLLATTCHGLVPLSPAPGVFAHGNHDGLALARTAPDGSWVPLGRHERIRGTTVAVAEFPAGVVWAASQSSGLWRIDFRGGPRLDAPAKNYPATDPILAGLTQFNVVLFPWAGGFGGSIANRLVRFDETSDRFIPETRIDGLPRPQGVVSLSPIGVKPTADGTLWLQAVNQPVTHIVPAGPDRWRAEIPPGPGLPQLHLTTLLPDPPTQTLWLAGANSLVSRDLGWRPTAPPAPFHARIRRVDTNRGALVWADPATAATTAASARTALAADQNALRVHFTAATFTGDHLGRAQLQFRSRLDGLDSQWTDWTAETQRDFTNLPYRDFVFRVEARDAQGRAGSAATFAFAIAPPWWLARAMFAAYGLAGLVAVAGLVRWRTRHLRRRAENLEAVVAARTDELRRSSDDLRASNAELARLHALERDEKLAARLDEEKARLEMLRYQLNPHFLYNTLASICGTARVNPDATRTMAQRLADFCRLTLTRADEMETVREELRMLQSYLDIEKARWRDSLQIEIDVAPAALDARLPAFLLLPLVENAIKHGGRTSPDVLRIRLSIQRDPAGALLIEVANTGLWATPTPHPHSTGIGLENMRRRLARHAPSRHTFTIGPAGDWIIAKLHLRLPAD